MDYYAIGQKIRKLRKSQGLSQEELAEKIDISTTHMSHIETGNTKLSLPVLVDIAKSLQVSTDDLLRESDEETQSLVAEEIKFILQGCTSSQLRVILDIVKAAKFSLDKYEE